MDAETDSDTMIDTEEQRVADEKAKKPELPGVGHNSEISGNRLKSFIERVERLEEEKKALSEDIKDVYGEAKATGFDPKIMRKIVSLRKTNLEKRREESELLELYMSAIGMAE
jgi:uncharacterized protein (UPF0335 family)